MSNTSLPLTLYTAEQVRELDRIAIEEKGIAGLTLMERAAAATYVLLKQQWPEVRRLLVCCGTGNNGGDGYLLAAMASRDDYAVTVLAMVDVKSLQGDARSACDQWQRSRGQTIGPDQLSRTLPQIDLVIDAMLGTGLARDVQGVWADVINTINDSGKPVLAVDIPSGLNANTGQVMGAAIKATSTISYIGLKQGAFTASGREYCGGIVFDDLDVPVEIIEHSKPACQVIDPACLHKWLPPRPSGTHKGQCGHVLLVGGDAGMTGAIQMAAVAAARSGAGLVSIATRQSHAVEITTQRPELMCHGVESIRELETLLTNADVIAIGPGLGQSEWAISLLDRALQCDLPLVVDADALNLLAKKPFARNNRVLTPHPGEAARLLDCSNEDIQRDRFSAVKAIAEKYNAITVLKGSGSLVFDPVSQGCFLCRDGNPGMASGGMGDILTGVIAGLIAQGLPLLQATCCGVQIHASAADKAAEAGQRGTLATDLLPFIRQLVNS